MRTVEEILYKKQTPFNFIQATATVRDAITQMKCENVGFLIVLDKEKFAGIISERDYARKVILNNKHSETTLVKEIMAIGLPILSPDNTAEECMALMNASWSRYLPVFDNMEFKGVITTYDLMHEAAENAEKDNNLNEKEEQVQRY
jgi:CBS domain-containing protein